MVGGGVVVVVVVVVGKTPPIQYSLVSGADVSGTQVSGPTKTIQTRVPELKQNPGQERARHRDEQAIWIRELGRVKHQSGLKMRIRISFSIQSVHDNSHEYKIITK